MKIRIGGCTAEELAKESYYLSLGKHYEAKKVDGCKAVYQITADDGEVILVRFPVSAHLPEGAKWVEVSE